MSLVFFDDVVELQSKAKSAPGMNVFQVYDGPFPLVNDALDASGNPGPRTDIELVVAKVFKVTVGNGDHAAVLLCRLDATDKPFWSVYCGDKQVAGDFPNDGKSLAATLRAAGVVNSAVVNQLEGSAWVGSVPNQDNCPFFRIQAASGKLCRHVETMLATVSKEDMEAMATTLKAWKSGGAGSLKRIPTNLSDEQKAALRVAFVKPVLLAGERGSGKTFFARQLADYLDATYLEMQMHPSMEPWEFRMHERFVNGKPVQVMGKLAEAVFWIQQGKRVVLCMDEFFNMNPVYQTVINSPLSRTRNNTYLIETGRVIEMENGCGVYEVVEVPCDMLWVVATTNVGARYGLDKVAPSVRARFRIIMMNTSADTIKTIVETELKTRGMPVEFAEMFKKLISACNTAVAQNEMDEEATTRMACDVIYAAHAEAVREKQKLKTKAQWLPLLKTHLLDEIAQVVNFELGPLDPTQESKYKALVNGCFK